MTREDLIKILEDYEIFVDDDFGGSYKSIIAYTSDKKVSRSHTPIGTLKIIDTFEEIQNQNKRYKEVIDKLNKLEDIRLLTMYFEDGGEMSVLPYEDILDILKEVE